MSNELSVGGNDFFANFGADKIMSNMFKRIDNVVWDMMTGKMGVVTNKGILSATVHPVVEPAKADDTDEVKLLRKAVRVTEADVELSINPFDSFSMGIPAFGQITSRDQVKVGDLVISNDEVFGWVSKINERSFGIMKFNGATTERWSPPKMNMMGMVPDGIMVVRSLIDMGGQSGFSAMQPMLMMQMQMMGSTGDHSMMDQMMPMMLMQMMGGNGMMGMVPDGAANPMNPMAGMANMMPMMMMPMMMKMMKGAF